MFTQYRLHHIYSLRGFIMSIITAPQYYLTMYHDGLRRDEERVLCFLGDPMKFNSVVCTAIDTVYDYSNNQRLWGAGDNDRRSKRFCSIAVLCVSLTRQIRSQNTRDQITSDGRSKRSWSDLRSVHFIPFILNGRLTECC